MQKLYKVVYAPIVFTLFVSAAIYFYQDRTDLNIPGVRYFAQPVSLEPFGLQDQFSRRYDLTDLEGHWTVMFFGYTFCPDICPTAMQDLHNVYNKLKADNIAHKLKVVFVSVDPLRDSPAVLKEYLEYFNPEFLGLSGKRSELDKLTSRVGVIYEFEDARTGEPIRDVDNLDKHPGYIVNHYSSLILINPQAEMVAHIYPPHDSDRVVDIINIIQNT